MLAITAVRDEQRFLPGFLAMVAPQVDGIVALDDGSGDGSAEVLAGHPAVLEVLHNDPARPAWDEPGNHARLVAAACAHDAQWILAIDADERPEAAFRDRAERVIARGSRRGFDAYAVVIRELWDHEDRWRADGPWGRKSVARLFAARPDHAVDARALHAHKAPEQAKRVRGELPLADLWLWHRRMLTEEDRQARRARYEALDPDGRWQPREGYAYLTSRRGIDLRRVPKRRAPAPEPR